MDDYEVLKELKVCYEYINDLLENCDYISFEDDKTRNHLNKTTNILSDLYSNCYEMAASNEDSYEELKTNLNCPHCNEKVLISDLINYSYVCNECDENFYLGEGDLNDIWYLKNNDEKLEYYIQIWKTEEDRDRGDAFEYLETYYDDLQAIEKAKKIFDNNKYACVEVVKRIGNKAIFLKDSEEEQYYYDGKTISFVSNYVLTQYIENWNNKKELPIYNNLLYCEDLDKYVAIDNTTGNCWTEEFENKENAINWLIGKDNKKTLEEDLNEI